MIAGLFLLSLSAAQAPIDHGAGPGARRPLAGMAGFECVSKIDFGAEQNRLTAAYVFPDRVRWHFESYGARERSEHHYVYRTGMRVYELVSGKPSRELAAEQRDAVVLQMELRRAAMLWPDGFDWADDPNGSRSAAVRADSCCWKLPLGTLVATLADGRPCRIEARDALGRAIEALEIRAWQERAGRTWPLTLALEGNTGFVETIESIETRVHYLELSFLPPDLRPLLPPGDSGPTVSPHEIVAMTYAVRALPEGIDWEHALGQARHWIAEAAANPEFAVDTVPTFALSREGRPEACLVRLLAPRTPAPDGFETRTERAGLFVVLSELAAVDAAAIARLLRAIPEGALPGTPYLRVHPRPNPLELVLPLEPTE